MADFTNLEAIEGESPENAEEVTPRQRKIGKKSGEKWKKADRRADRRGNRQGWRAEAHEIKRGLYARDED